MSTHPSSFKSPKGEAQFMAAYDATLRLWPVAYEPIDLRSRFGVTHLVACGPRDAPPLILLHCFFMGLTAWAQNVADLCRDHRVYALDVMGQPGKSIPDEPMRNRSEMTEWLGGTLDALAIERTGLMGWSYGGFFALNYAIHAPDRLTKLVLLTPIGSFISLPVQFYIRGLLARLGRAGSDNMMRWFFHGPSLRDQNTRQLYDAMAEQFHQGLRHFRLPPIVPPAPFADAELRTVMTPTLLLIGRNETLYDPLPAIERAKRLIPHIEAEIVAQAGHELPAGQPANVNKRVLQFLHA